jgi:hypothetical protein
VLWHGKAKQQRIALKWEWNNLGKQCCIQVTTITQLEASWKTLLHTVCMQYATLRTHNPSDRQGAAASGK